MNNRFMLQTRCKDGFVSTVDLINIPHHGPMGWCYYYETMIVTNTGGEDIVERYKTSGEATIGHQRWIESLGGRTLLQL